MPKVMKTIPIHKKRWSDRKYLTEITKGSVSNRALFDRKQMKKIMLTPKVGAEGVNDDKACDIDGD